MNTIYKHVDFEGYIRYIGETALRPEKRLNQHLCEARRGKRSHRLNWLRSLTGPPTVEIIEQVPEAQALEREIYWISLAREYGCRLVNGTDGGEGCFGYKHTPAGIEKMRQAKLGRKISAAHCASIRAGNMGKTRSLESRAKMSAAQLQRDNKNYMGRTHSPETREKLRIANVGKVLSAAHKEKLRGAHIGKIHSPETRAKMSASHKARLEKMKASICPA